MPFFRFILLLMLAAGATAAVVMTVTNAIFTDTASVGSNTVSLGTVDISTTPTSAFITASNMVPGSGSAVTASLVVNNAGSLQFRYAMTTSNTNTTVSDSLTLTIKTIDVTTPGVPCDNFDGTTLYGPGTLTAGALGSNVQGAQAGDRTLNAGANETLCFRVELPLSATGQGGSTTATFTFDAEQTANNP